MIKFSTNPNVIGKPPKHMLGALMQPPWVNIECSIEDWFELIATDGRIFGPCIDEENNPEGRKIDDTFVSNDIVLVDIDGGTTIEQMKEHPFYKAFCAGYYTSPSYTDEVHKFRLIFILEEPITNGTYMHYLYSALNDELGGDKKCEDASRCFFGTQNAERKELDASVILPKIIVDALIQEVIEREQEKVRREQEEIREQALQPQWGNTMFKEEGDVGYKVENAPFVAKGGRDNMLISEAGKMLKMNVPIQDALQLIALVGATKCSPPVSRSAAEAKVRYAYKKYRR